MNNVSIALDALGLLMTLLLLNNCIAERIKSRKHNLFVGIILVNIAVLFSDMMTWIIDAKPEHTVLLYVFNTIVYGGGYIMVSLYLYYILRCIRKINYVSMLPGHIVGVTTVIFNLLLIVSVFTHSFFAFVDGIYIRGPLFWMCMGYPFVIIIISMIIILKHRKDLKARKTLAFLSYGILPLMAVIIQFMAEGITVIYIATTFALYFVYVRVYVEQSRELKEREYELQQMKVSVMLSQIQPHFLYNALTSIQGLCIKDPEQAKSALGEFSKFLRGNMDSLSSQNPIPFTRELEHVKNYLSLEKIRFGERLNIEYEIEEEDFFIPALTLQPIVENSVKHGIFNMGTEGKIVIRTTTTENRIVIEVEDNGQGFPAKSFADLPKKSDGRTHIGLSNVRQRIMEMIGGTLELTSSVGKGTLVTITIPRVM